MEKELAKDIRGRLKRLRTRMGEDELGGFLAGNPRNLRYLTGKDTGRILVTADQTILWVRGLYKELYSYEGCGFEIRTYEKDAVKDHIASSNIKKLGIENIGVLEYRKLREELKPELEPTRILEKMRVVKSGYEIARLRKAAEIAKKGMYRAYELIDSGLNELEAVAEIEAEIRRCGSETPPFDDGMLLASGKEAADIHARARMGNRMRGLVVVDLGGRFEGYYSDMTRTFEAGKASREERDVLEFVDNLRTEAIDRLSVGVKAADVHGFVEEKMKEKGFAFHHSTGHGVGLEIHEAPNLGPGSEDILEENMVFTIEPGVYLPGKFGVRFEDTVVLGKNKAENITR